MDSLKLKLLEQTRMNFSDSDSLTGLLYLLLTVTAETFVTRIRLSIGLLFHNAR